MKRAIPMLLLVCFFSAGCQKAPPTLSPDAQAAFYATRVVHTLDAIRDTAIAANNQTPPLISTADTRQVVLWHQTAVHTIQAVPGGWKVTVKAGMFALTCLPAASDVQPPPPCTPQLPAATVTRLAPYVSLALVVISEVK